MTVKTPGNRPVRRWRNGVARYGALLLCGAALGACSFTGLPQHKDLRVQASHAVEPEALATGIAHLKAERNAKAAELLEDVVLSYPDNLRALNALATAYDRMGRYDLAVRIYHRALAQAPDDPATLNNIGYSYLLQGRRDLAISYLAVAEERLAGQEDADAERLRRVRMNLAMAEYEEAPQGPSMALAGGLSGPGTPGLAGLAASDEGVSLPHLLRSGQAVQFLMTQEASLATAPGVTFELDRSAPDETAARRDMRRAPSLSLVTTRPPPPNDGSPPGALATARIELSNGAGLSGMAASFRRALGRKGVEVARLTNAERFSFAETTVFYRPGFAEPAAWLARELGVEAAVQPASGQRSDIRVRLGGDLVPLARQIQ